ncbi:alpha-ketoglutarate-dependent dioxygenase AlkB [Agaribacterium sp. ZY112]|uniref:alpha-ketoglutarate-dependent dioxygenase AlkB family protein n=1 Tax=Agaribacterium sp. ZY112 TaxID=3233574 RepID=UPI003525B1E7
MDLFSHLANPQENLLPRGGVVNYYGPVLEHDVAEYYFERLLNEVNWQYDEAKLYGKHIITKRKVAWYADQAFDYHYSGTKKRALAWIEPIAELRMLAEEKTGECFNACLLNLYHTGSESMAWHSDAEKELKRHGAIASLSLGAERKFCFRHKGDKEKVEVKLEHGSLLVMKGATQTFWQHCLPATKKVDQPRISLTFRSMLSP